MNNGPLIKVNEVRVDGDSYVHKSCLLNPTKIITIQSGLLSKQGPHLIGAERERELRMIVLEGNNRIFVDETVEEIADMIH